MNQTTKVTGSQCITCPICGHSESRTLPFYDLDKAVLTFVNSEYHWRVCLFCGNGYPSSQPKLADLQRYWNNNRKEGVAAAASEAIYQRRLKDAEYWADETYRFASPFISIDSGAFLDIACGLGATVKLFKDRGWNAVGVDADPATLDSHKRLGIETEIGQFETMKLDRSFDLISIAHAIYFMTNYKSFMNSIKAGLNKGGFLLITISNFGSSFGSGSPSQVHTWYPTPASLVNAMSLSGFYVVKRKTLRGSTMVLFQQGNEPAKMSRALWSAVMLRSHNMRYNLVGRHIVNVVRMAKRN